MSCPRSIRTTPFRSSGSPPAWKPNSDGSEKEGDRPERRVDRARTRRRHDLSDPHGDRDDDERPLPGREGDRGSRAALTGSLVAVDGRSSMCMLLTGQILPAETMPRAKSATPKWR